MTLIIGGKRILRASSIELANGTLDGSETSGGAGDWDSSTGAQYAKEFDSISGWSTCYGFDTTNAWSPGAGPVDPMRATNAAGTILDFTTRPGWALSQVSNGGSPVYYNMYRDVSGDSVDFTGDFTVVCKAMMNIPRVISGTAHAMFHILSLVKKNTNDLNYNAIHFGFYDTDTNLWRIRYYRVDNGVTGGAVNLDLNSSYFKPIGYCYPIIRHASASDDFYLYIGGVGGEQQIASITKSANKDFDHVVLTTYTAAATSFDQIYGTKFVHIYHSKRFK